MDGKAQKRNKLEGIKMSKWINSKINQFLGTALTVRETEILSLSSIFTALVAFIFTMYTAIFPNL